MAPGPATDAMFCGRAKIPDPMVEPIMIPTSVHIRTVWLFAGVAAISGDGAFTELRLVHISFSTQYYVGLWCGFTGTYSA